MHTGKLGKFQYQILFSCANIVRHNMLKFRNVFKRIIFYCTLSGLCVPGLLEDSTETMRTLLRIYSQFSVLPMLVLNILLAYLVMYQWKSITDLTMTVNVLYFHIYGAFITEYFYFSRTKFLSFFEKLNAAGLMFYNNPLLNKEISLKRQKSFTINLNFYTNLYCISLCFTSGFHCFLMYLKYLGLFGIDEDALLVYQLPYKPTSLLAVTMTTLLQTFAGQLCVLKRSSCECLIAFLILYLDFHFEQLGVVLESILNKTHNTHNDRNELRRWIELHKQTQR